MHDKKESRGKGKGKEGLGGTSETGEGLQENGECGHLLPNKTVAQVGDSNYSSSNIGCLLHMKSSWAKSSKSAWKEGKPAFCKALACHIGKSSLFRFV